MIDQLKSEVGNAISQGVTWDGRRQILLTYRDLGMSEDTMTRALLALREELDPGAEDELLELLDLVVGWCQPHLRVFD